MRARSPEYLINEAARMLAEVPTQIWDGQELPVPIDAVAEDHFGLLIRESVDIAAAFPEQTPSDGAPVSGALIPEAAEIWVDATEVSRNPRRRRDAVAHELGHWVLHRGPETVLCAEGVVEPAATVTRREGASPRTWQWDPLPAAPQIEWEANLFGGALLLPPWLVREVWERTPSLEALAEAFDCSLPAIDGGWQEHYGFVAG